MLSHGNLLHNVESCRLVLAMVEDDSFAVILPLFHTYMMTVGIFLPFTVGGSIVLVKSLHPPRAALQEIFSRRATILPAVPSFYRMLLGAQLPTPMPIRIFISGSAPLPMQTLNEFEEKFRVPLIEGYGLSEASPVVSKNPLKGVRKAGSIGIPVPNVEMSVQDESGALLGANETGEICVRGGNVMLGYWNQPEETTKVFRNGWLLTGDVGHRDADGYYYITDRKKDMLIVNGINVYPREIEEVIYHFPGVKEAAVIGVPDARRGEQPMAFVAAAEGQTLDEKALHEFIRSKLADYKVPRTNRRPARLPKKCDRKDFEDGIAETGGHLVRQDKRNLMPAVLIQRRPIHSVFARQAGEVKIGCPAARGRGRAVEHSQITRKKLRLNFPVPKRQHFPRFIHRRAKRRLRGNANETQFDDRTHGDGFSFLPTNDALMMFVVSPQPRQQGGYVQEVGHGN